MFKFGIRTRVPFVLGAILSIVLIAAACGGDDTPAPAASPAIDTAALSALVQEAVKGAVPTGPAPLSEQEIQKAVETAVAAATPQGATADDIAALVREAVSAIPAPAPGVTRSEVESAIASAVVGIQTGVSQAEVEAAIASGVAGLEPGVTAGEVQDIVAMALEEPKGTIVFADLNWDSAQIQNAIARFIVEKGYGYPTDAIFGATVPLWPGLLGGDIDVSMEIWLPNQKDVWEPALARGEVIPVGKSLDDNWQTAYVVPTYVVEQNPGLKTVQDIRDHLDLFPQEGGKVVLWNCLSAWACSAVNEAQLTAYGLDDVITLKDPGSQAGLFASLQGSYEKGEYWLGYLWGPTQPSSELELTRLEEPACGVGQDPGDGCGYPTALIRIAVPPTLIGRAPDVIEFLRKSDFTADADVAANAYKADSGATFEEVAIWFLENRDDAWTQWVTREAAAKVKAAKAGREHHKSSRAQAYEKKQPVLLNSHSVTILCLAVRGL